MLSYWIVDNTVIEVSPGDTHAGVARDFFLTYDEAIKKGWIRVFGNVGSGWDFEVHDIRDPQTVESIRTFMEDHEWSVARIESHKPRGRIYVILEEDEDADLDFHEAIESATRKAVLRR